MSEGLPLKQITIIRIITMAAGLLGALVMLLEAGFFAFGPDYTMSFSNSLVAMVGILCLFNLFRHLRIWRRLPGPQDPQAPA